MSFLFLPVFSGISQEKDREFSAIQIVETMFDSVYQVKQTKFEMFSRERVDGELIKSHAIGVINFEPKKIFLRGFDQDGVLLNEVLFIAGENNNNALISPNGFPYININLDPLGSTMRRNRHFTMLEAGGRHLVDMLAVGMKHYAQIGNVASRFEVAKMSETNLKVTIINEDYTLVTYSVKKAQTIREMANSLGVPEYKIIELNEDISDFDDEVVKGQVVMVPNLYAQKVELILRSADLIPMQVRIFDEKGLYSEYIYTIFDTHPVISNVTFNKENPAYTF
ncbi:MAG: hypothetical protein ACI9GM_001380 [Salibacteraceae bacterium]|jgi:hypothetical protein